MQNPDVIKAMNRAGDSSTPRKRIGDDDEDQDDTGFFDASSFFETSSISKQRKRTPSTQRSALRKSITGWQTLRK